MARIEGVGPDAPTIINEKGARQSSSPYRFDLLPPLALAHIASVMKIGAEKYGANSYIDINPDDHLNHALQHIFAYCAGDIQEGDVIEHAKHAACRIMFWLECLERNMQDDDTDTEDR